MSQAGPDDRISGRKAFARTWPGGVLGGLLLGSLLGAAELPVSDPESARLAVRAAQPGDVIVLAKGEWRDVDLRFEGEGEEKHPILIRAEVAGQTLITGASRLRLGGAHLVVSGLRFQNLSGAKADWLEFRLDSKRRARHCRVTECAFEESPDFSPQERECRWIGIYGQDNQLDRCRLQGKKTKGATVVVWLGELDPGGHRILANHFGPRPRLGENGGESLRIGDSKTAEIRAACLVQGNHFIQCDGEVECISNKSSHNIYRGNAFIETLGTLTLRHGNDCLVEGNFFLGKRPGTGGVRVIGRGHRLVGNAFFQLEGDGFRSAICLVNGLPNSPAHGYHQVADVEIRENFITDCKEPLLIGYNDVPEATLAPRALRFVGNEIHARKGRPALRVIRAPEGVSWTGNHLEGDCIGIDVGEGMRGARTGLSTHPWPLQSSEVGPSWSSD